jgi:carboxymethylenebutenolidase
MDRVYVMQLVRSFQVGELDRRQFLVRATAALGSAAAATLLLSACTPVTGPTAPVVEAPAPGTSPMPSPEPTVESTSGLVTASVEYPGSDGATLMGYLAQPAGEGSWPAVIVIQEWWGLNEHIKDVTRRFAAEGFVALAPDLYHGVVVSEPNEARKLVMELDTPAAVGEIRSAVDYLQAQDFVAGAKVGITGFCMGGGLTLQTALVEDDLGAAVPFYGSPLSAVDAARVTAPLQGHYGSEDGGIPVSAVKTMEEGLDAAGIPNEIYVYEGAQHAFFNDTRSSYDPEAAAQAWERTLTWFREYLAE